MGRTVYSTDRGRLCPDCGAVKADCRCRLVKAQTPGSDDGVVRIRRETKGRGGKAVTIVTGLALADTELKAMAKTLKQRCGVGGAVKEGNIEIQGEQRETIRAYLEKEGYRVKLAGG
ncbi:MAG: translation initiation factor Sui1 [Halieaceae bacterium]|nr:translation initiation factor Sui1 [Halieaceae bacterium]